MQVRIVFRALGCLLVCGCLGGAVGAQARQGSRVSVTAGAQQQRDAKEQREQSEQKQEQQQASGTAASAPEQSSAGAADQEKQSQDAAAERARCMEIAANQFAQDRTMARVDYNECRRTATNADVCEIRYQETLAQIDEMQGNWVIMNCYGDPEEYYKNRP